MNIILGKDGKLSVNESPLQGKEAETLENVLALIENPSDGDAIVYDADAGIWKAGEVSGGGGSSGGGALIVNGTTPVGSGTTTLDKTWKEISDAVKSVGAYILNNSDDGTFSQVVTAAYIDDGTYIIEDQVFVTYNGTTSIMTEQYSTDSENGYPSFTMGPPGL